MNAAEAAHLLTARGGVALLTDAELDALQDAAGAERFRRLEAFRLSGLTTFLGDADLARQLADNPVRFGFRVIPGTRLPRVPGGATHLAVGWETPVESDGTPRGLVLRGICGTRTYLTRDEALRELRRTVASVHVTSPDVCKRCLR